MAAFRGPGGSGERLAPAILVAFLAAGCGDDGGGGGGGPAPAAITVISPDGGETWVAGTAVAVTWSTTGTVGDVVIELSMDGGAMYPITLAATTANDGSELVTVPNARGMQCRVRVSELDGTPSDASDLDFTIPFFTDIGAGLTGALLCAVAWGDCDNDGDLDLALSGYEPGFVNQVNIIYGNDAGSFGDIGAGLTGQGGRLAWGDYDNDGDVDLAMPRAWGGSTYVVYRNNGGSFATIDAGLRNALLGALGFPAWGDYDNDGDLDVALAGEDSLNPVSKVYPNDAGTFVDIGAGLTGVRYCSLAWGDYDNDGDLDLALAGSKSGGIPVSEICRNDAGTFTDIDAGLTGVLYCSLAWGDYDNDGDLDLVLAGNYISKVYRNDAGTFTDIGAGLRGVTWCSLAWGDYDNDGDLDLALAGYALGGPRIGRLYRNDGSDTFTLLGVGLTEVFAGVSDCSLAWGDYDNDGDLDLALAGEDVPPSVVSKIYRNDGGTPNTAPSAPTGLSASVSGNDVTFSWASSTDTETPQPGLSCNLRVGTTPGGDEVSSGTASVAGWRRIPARGAIQPGPSVNEWRLTVPAGTYYWSVQAVDTGFMGSAWAAEESVPVL